MNTTNATSETSAAPRKGLKPYQLSIALGVGIATFTMISGIIPNFVHWKSDSPIHREVFEGIPGYLQIAFYTIIPALLYFGFLVLLGVTTVLEIDHQVPPALKFLHGDVYRAYAAVGDIAGIVFTGGVIWAIIRRYVQRPYRIRIKSKPEHAIGLGVLLAIGVTGFTTEMFRIAESQAAGVNMDHEKWSVLGYPLAQLVNGWSVSTLDTTHQVMWVAHVLAFIAFLIILPITMLRHMFTSPLNMYLKDRERPKGAMKAMPNLTETSLETFGAHVVEDFTWKQLLDLDACTMCGRCTSVCPAHATGKPLDPREIVLKSGEVMAATASHARGGKVTPPLSVDSEITISANSLFERITSEEIWACTSCKACDEICPVNIEILDKILDMRRYLSLMESDFPAELGNAYRAMENQGNPWGMSQSDRGEWAKDLDVTVLDPGAAFNHEYLYWVGCAGSFDDKNKKVTQSMAKLLKRAGIDVAILGPSEMCTGDSARRSGNEYLFQMLAMPNIEMLNGMGVRKIITQCPHCFNTLANEYPQFGGTYEVIHHSQLLEHLIDSGKLDISDATLEERITYHDSCYLGRHNDVYMAPRNVVSSIKGVDVVEMPRNGTKGMCCGAGGARMWMEETIGTKVNDERAAEAISTGASRVATACPFCYIMLDDGVKGAGKEENEVKVADISIHLLDAIENGERIRAAGAAPLSAPVAGE